MPDSFIHKLNESNTNLNNKDYVIFDVLDSVKLTYDSKKISFSTLNNTITANLIPYLDTIYIRTSAEEEESTIKISETNFSVEKPSIFKDTIDMDDNPISNVGDPVNQKDAVNLNYLTNTLSEELSLYMPISGGEFVSNVTFKGISEKYNQLPALSTLILNLSSGNNFEINLNTNISSISVNNIPSTNAFTITLVIKQLGVVGNYFDITWNINGSTVKWAQDAVPTITKTTNKFDIFAISKFGSNWFGFVGGQEF
jgi:hypothetical protein